MKVLQLISLLVWPAIIILPLILTSGNLYESLFSPTLYVTEQTQYLHIHNYGSNIEFHWPSPLGLSLGRLAVVIGQIFTLLYFYIWSKGQLGELIPVEKEGAPAYSFFEGMQTHLAQPEGFVMLGGYLTISWMFGLMPSTYYSFSGGINWWHVLAQLLIQDLVQYGMHLFEHHFDKRLYRWSHKP